MELRVTTADLVRELALAQGVVETKTTIPVLANVLLEARDDFLSITSSDLEIGLRSRCPARVQTPGSVTVSSRRLYEYVRLLPNAEVHIEVDSTNSLRISCGSAKTRISGMDTKNFPDLPEQPAVLTTIPAKTLENALKRAIISVSDEQSHYTLAGALVDLRPDSVAIISTDGHRLSLYKEFRSGNDIQDPVSGLLSRNAMAELLKVVSEAKGSAESPAQVELSVDENSMHFRSEQRVFSARKLTGKFPEYERVMPRDLDIVLRLDNDMLTKALRRVSQFTDERSRVVRFVLEEGRLHLIADNADFGSSRETLLVEYDGDSIDVGFNAQYILDFLRVCDSETVLLRLRDSRSAGQMGVPGNRQDAEWDYRYVIMPIRV